MTKHEFLKDVTNWSNHRGLLWNALEATSKSNLPVIELGAGNGSTPYLRAYCEANKREFLSFDYDKSWAEKFGSIYVDNWDAQGFWKREYSVCLIDMSPGEYRRKALIKIHAEIVVIHDSEPIGWNSSDYKVRPLFKNFKYKVDQNSEQPGGAWASALSNKYNVSTWQTN